MKILWRSDTDEITFKAIKKHRYGLRETVASERLIRAEFYKKITIYTHFFNCFCFLLTNVMSAAPHIITSGCFCPKMPRTNVHCLTLSHLNVQLTLIEGNVNVSTALNLKRQMLFESALYALMKLFTTK